MQTQQQPVTVKAQKNVEGLTPRELREFGEALDLLRARVFSELGEEDASYIRRVLKVQRSSEFLGRVLLTLGLFPPAFVAGVAALSLSKILENMEIGHNVLHGQYDWLNDPELYGANYEWDWCCPSASWRHTHNFVHHTFTNIVGQDRDVGYGVLRMAESQTWHPYNLPQPIYALLQMVLFEWAVAVHELEFDRYLKGERSLSEVIDKAVPVLRKALPQTLKDYALFPLLAGPAAPAVLAGNLSANLIRNVWAFLVIFCGHFPTDVAMHEAPKEGDDSRAAWYVRQITGSANIEGSRVLHILTGHLSHQIEHHLFPDMPARRYPQIAGEVRALCERYGVPYHSGRFGTQVASAAKRIAYLALPPGVARLRGRDLLRLLRRPASAFA